MKTTNPFKEVQRLLKSSIQSKTSRHKKRKSGPYRFEVRLVPPEAYPDLKENPFNPYTQLSDEERLEEFIEIMGIVWAETCLEKARAAGLNKKDDNPEQHLQHLGCTDKIKAYNVIRTNNLEEPNDQKKIQEVEQSHHDSSL